MTSFEDIRDKALDLAQAGVAKAKELTDIAKLNISNTAEEEAIKKAYVELGKLYYAERGMAPEGAYATLCEKITAAKTRVEENKAKISEIRCDCGVQDAGVDSCDCGCGCTTDAAPEEPGSDEPKE